MSHRLRCLPRREWPHPASGPSEPDGFQRSRDPRPCPRLAFGWRPGPDTRGFAGCRDVPEAVEHQTGERGVVALGQIDPHVSAVVPRESSGQANRAIGLRPHCRHLSIRFVEDLADEFLDPVFHRDDSLRSTESVHVDSQLLSVDLQDPQRVQDRDDLGKRARAGMVANGTLRTHEVAYAAFTRTKNTTSATSIQSAISDLPHENLLPGARYMPVLRSIEPIRTA